MSKKKKSLEGNYDKVYVSGSSNYSSTKESVYIQVKDFGYSLEQASVYVTVEEAKKIIVLIENAIKEATKKEKK